LVAWCFAFFGGAACSGAMVVVLSGGFVGAASTTFGGSAVGESAVVGTDAVTAASAPPGVTVVDGETAGKDGVGVAEFTTGFAAWPCGIARADARAAASDLSFGAAAATESGGNANFAGAVTVAGAAGATDGTAAARTLVTIARAATGVFSGSAGRSISDRTTPAPAVAPIAVAAKTTRAVRAKLGAGAK